ncbi:MAG: magnesium transporter MgtE N-terminal domain-containing protein, partial [Bacteroides sp.]
MKALIKNKALSELKTELKEVHPADIAELMNDFSSDEARTIYRLLDNEAAADVLVEMDDDIRKEFLDILPSETIAHRFIDHMDTDDAVDLIRDLDATKQNEILSHLDDVEQAGNIVDLL